MTIKELTTSIETLSELTGTISEVKSKISSLNEEAGILTALCEGLNLEQEQRQLNLLETTITALKDPEVEKVLSLKVNSLKENISNLKRFNEEIPNEKEKLSGELSELLEKFASAKKIYDEETKRFEEELAKLGVELCGKEVANSQPTPSVAVEEEEESIATETGEDEEKDEVNTTETADPIEALLCQVKRYDEIYRYETSCQEPKEYDAVNSEIWYKFDISENHKALIGKICDEEEIPGMSAKNVEKLKLSLPTELLEQVGRDDVIEERHHMTDTYTEDFLNKWRPKFTYSVIKKLYDLVKENVAADGKKQEEVDAFMEDNTDHMEKVSFFKIEKPVYEAFCIVD